MGFCETYTLTSTSKRSDATGIRMSPSQKTGLVNIIWWMPENTAPTRTLGQTMLKERFDIFRAQLNNIVFSPVKKHEQKPKAYRSPNRAVREPRPWVCDQSGFQTNCYHHILVIKKMPINIWTISVEQNSYRINHVAQHQIASVASIRPNNITFISVHWHPIKNNRVNHRISNPNPKHFHIKQSGTLKVFIKSWVSVER